MAAEKKFRNNKICYKAKPAGKQIQWTDEKNLEDTQNRNSQSSRNITALKGR